MGQHVLEFVVFRSVLPTEPTETQENVRAVGVGRGKRRRRKKPSEQELPDSSSESSCSASDDDDASDGDIDDTEDGNGHKEGVVHRVRTHPGKYCTFLIIGIQGLDYTGILSRGLENTGV